MWLNARLAGHGNQVSKRMLSYCSSWSNLNTWSNLSICEYVTEVLRTRAPLTLNGNVCKSRCTNVAGHIRFPIVHGYLIFVCNSDISAPNIASETNSHFYSRFLSFHSHTRVHIYRHLMLRYFIKQSVVRFESRLDFKKYMLCGCRNERRRCTALLSTRDIITYHNYDNSNNSNHPRLSSLVFFISLLPFFPFWLFSVSLLASSFAHSRRCVLNYFRFSASWKCHFMSSRVIFLLLQSVANASMFIKRNDFSINSRELRREG